MKYLLFLLFLLSQAAALAQGTIPRCFKAYDAPAGGNEINVFCVGQRVYFRDCGGIDADKEYYDYDSSNGLDFTVPEARNKYHTYTQPGTYTVTQFGNIEGDNRQFQRQFEVKATAAPAFTVTACAGRSVTVNVTDNTYSTYKLSFGDNRAPVDLVPGQQRQHTFASDGTYTLTLTGTHSQASCTTTPATKTITTVPALPVPQLSELTVVNKTATGGAIRFVLEQADPQFTYLLEEVSNSSVTGSEELKGIQQGSPFILLMQDIDTSRPRCYRIRATDACGTERISPTVCSVVLTATALASGEIRLDWLSAQSGRVYTLELLGQQDNVLATYPVTGTTYTANPDDTDEPILRYRIRAASGNGASVTYSNTEAIPQPVRFFVPSAFTPNGDDLNDFFEVKGKHFQNFRIKIYNKMGQVVFESDTAAPGWDGRFNGKDMPQGVYVYEIYVQAPDGATRTSKGTVTLLR